MLACIKQHWGGKDLIWYPSVNLGGNRQAGKESDLLNLKTIGSPKRKMMKSTFFPGNEAFDLKIRRLEMQRLE